MATPQKLKQVYRMTELLQKLKSTLPRDALRSLSDQIINAIRSEAFLEHHNERILGSQRAKERYFLLQLRLIIGLISILLSWYIDYW